MPSARQIVYVITVAATSAHAAFGPAFSTGPTSSGVYIQSSTATLVIPHAHAPSNNSGDLSLWVGMGTSGGDLIQSIVQNLQTTWDVYAYTLKQTSATSQEAILGKGSAKATAGAYIKMNYRYSASTGNYTQTVYLNGAVVSTLSTSDGYAQGWGSAVECAATDCGTIPAHIVCSPFLISLFSPSESLRHIPMDQCSNRHVSS
ncbi:hypothetical protein EYC84_002010 [Monilinia fructicola]|uniref:Uncharacterized protein n=1 Tax=Monilinia fructicola TaxID=38448 RepID=A0A5M9JZG4_MONFR|nr:hypothetical protein EYC84_002010 [Monilinia fructicola]